VAADREERTYRVNCGGDAGGGCGGDGNGCGGGPWSWSSIRGHPKSSFACCHDDRTLATPAAPAHDPLAQRNQII